VWCALIGLLTFVRIGLPAVVKVTVLNRPLHEIIQIPPDQLGNIVWIFALIEFWLTF
jgi:hypothetical protein